MTLKIRIPKSRWVAAIFRFARGPVLVNRRELTSHVQRAAEKDSGTPASPPRGAGFFSRVFADPIDLLVYLNLIGWCFFFLCVWFLGVEV